jgi:tRNA threonylcarbamoyladenosine biosynthesis protein TsaB
MSNAPLILAVDTTSEFASVAVRRRHATVAEVHLRSTDGFGHLIMQAIEEALAQAAVRLEEVDCFAAASGPGSFTGVRVGLAAVKGLAEALHKPAAGISNLRALSLFGSAPLRAVALDARRGQIYGAVYDSDARLVSAETVAIWDEWRKTVPDGAEFVGLEASVPRWLAAAVAECAEMDGPAGWSDPVAIDANYVRRSDAEMFWKDA